MATRKSKQLTKKELALIKKALRSYGAKAELSRHTNLSAQTLRNILKSGTGLEQNVQAIQNFFIAKAAA